MDFAEAASFALYFSGSEAALSTPHHYISTLATWPGIWGRIKTEEALP